MSNLIPDLNPDCDQPLHPQAVEGLELIARGRYFEAHEALEAAWRQEHGLIRDLYRGVLQAAVVYLHLSRGNLPGAVKVYDRCTRWLAPWPDTCRGIAVERLRRDLETAVAEARRLGPERLAAFDRSLLKPVEYARR